MRPDQLPNVWAKPRNPVTDCMGLAQKIAKTLGRSEGIYFLADRLRLVFKHDDGKTYFIEIREAGQ